MFCLAVGLRDDRRKWLFLRAGGAAGIARGAPLATACGWVGPPCCRAHGPLYPISLEPVTPACECPPVRSTNLGPGENGLPPHSAEIERELNRKGKRLTSTRVR